jgi:hypothetical protein
MKNELLFISLHETGILRIRIDNIQWMIRALVWGTNQNQYFDSEYIKTILCNADGRGKVVYPTFILAYIDGIYKQPGENFLDAANRFIADRIAKLTTRVTSTVNFLNRLPSLVSNYQERLANPEIFINNKDYPSDDILRINANFIPVINNDMLPSPACAPVAPPASAPPAASSIWWPFSSNAFRIHHSANQNGNGAPAGGRFASTKLNRRIRAKKYKSRKTRKLRK